MQVFGQADGQDLGGPAESDQRVLCGLRLEMVDSLPKRAAGGLTELGNHGLGEPGCSVHAGPDGGPSQRQLGGAVGGHKQSLASQVDLSPVAAELLAEGDRHCIHQVRAPRFDDAGERALTTLQSSGEVPQRRDQQIPGGEHCSDPDGGGKGVVAGLSGVDVVVGVDCQTCCEVSDPGHDLVQVHVGRRAGAGLEDVDGELVVVLSARNLARGFGDGLRDVGIQQREIGVDARGSGLDLRECMDDRQGHGEPGDGEVLHRPSRLGTPQGVRRHLDVAHRVVF